MSQAERLPRIGVPRAVVIKGCLDAPESTKAFLDCVLASTTREESDRCQ